MYNYRIELGLNLAYNVMGIEVHPEYCGQHHRISLTVQYITSTDSVQTRGCN